VSGAVILTLILPYEDADEIERRAELAMLAEPRRWRSRAAAVLHQVGLGRETFLIPAGTKVLNIEPQDDDAIAHVLTAVVADAFVTGSDRSGRRRYLHSAYLDELRMQLKEEEEDDDECQP